MKVDWYYVTHIKFKMTNNSVMVTNFIIILMK